MPNNQRQRRTCYASCYILYPVSAAHTSFLRMDSKTTSYGLTVGAYEPNRRSRDSKLAYWRGRYSRIGITHLVEKKTDPSCEKATARTSSQWPCTLDLFPYPSRANPPGPLPTGAGGTRGSARTWMTRGAVLGTTAGGLPYNIFREAPGIAWAGTPRSCPQRCRPRPKTQPS